MDVADNKALWDVEYDWKDAGEEWSGRWGSSKTQWFGSLLPRIQRFLPAENILEIGPGRGRWTHFLRDYCDRLVVVDVSETCIEACMERFAGDDRITYHVNDGKSLDMVEHDSIDFVFSFDSLVHVEADVVRDYLVGIAGKLTRDGVAFLHHSNLGEYERYFSFQRRLPARIRYRLTKAHIVKFDEWRARSVTADLVRRLCDEAGLQCIAQEIVNWGAGKRLIDCLSTITPASSKWARPAKVIRNAAFMSEADMLRTRTALYG